MSNFFTTSGNGLTMVAYDVSGLDMDMDEIADSIEEDARDLIEDCEVSRLELTWAVENIDEMISSIDTAKIWLLEQKEAGRFILGDVD